MESYSYCAIDKEDKKCKKSNLPCGIYNLMENDIDYCDPNKTNNNIKESCSSQVSNPSHRDCCDDGRNKKCTTGATGPTGPTGAGLLSFGYVYHFASILTTTILGGSNIPFSNNGPFSNITHTAGSTTITVTTTGIYEIFYGVTFTAGVGAQIALAVNGTIDASTPISALVTTGELTGEVILVLTANDQITLRNNSLITLKLALAPVVAAQITIKRLN